MIHALSLRCKAMTDVESRNPNLDRPAKRRSEEFDERAAGTGNSTSWDKEPPMVDDGSADGSPLVPQQKEDKGSSAKEDSDVEEVEDSDVEEVSATEEDYDSPDFMADYVGGVDDGDYCGYCELCVDNEVCKGCGNKDGIPAGEEERFNPLECRICGTSEHRTEYCASRQFNKLLKEEGRKGEDDAFKE
ncbi:putative transcription factor interactor and regulator CCHC(Zn) family [Rosa chinensis]|uniref:Putative transcription factor interactor and regulator CCHC(Zn) family n=1 Tax=Rosa chinensis TaxID=74649 RepID=A0A2P6Q2H8_ROSCH|nr:uncharacterized protein LOC112202578 [Rosa chinensis]PRQ28364.1 putative transcription factor interactor and regulator CCHC(Zn) family [Rosa chinensis]